MMIPKSRLKGEYLSGKEPRSGIPLAFPSLRAKLAYFTEAMSYHFWDHLKTGKA